jgi:two-component system NtrC family sensor kinase
MQWRGEFVTLFDLAPALGLAARDEDAAYAVILRKEAPRAALAIESVERLARLVVVDQHLPGMQGTEFCRVMRASSATNTIPLLILTGDTESGVERQGLESGADDYVAKSSDRDVLLARIELLLRRAATRSPEGFYRAQQILAVDDSPTYLALIEEELKRERYGVTAVADGTTALVAIARQQIDCAVVDLVMPGMDGIELCRRIAAHRGPGKTELPILIVTSHASKEKMMEALDAGADDFVEKSGDSTVLKARIRALLRRKSLHEEQERIQSALRDREVELARERAERKAAQARADLAGQIEAARSGDRQPRTPRRAGAASAKRQDGIARRARRRHRA